MAPSDVAYVGDTPDDMHSAIDAGAVAIGACWAQTANVVPGRVWTVVRTVAELANTLDDATAWQKTSPLSREYDPSGVPGCRVWARDVGRAVDGVPL
jgi:hypothetical protein